MEKQYELNRRWVYPQNNPHGYPIGQTNFVVSAKFFQEFYEERYAEKWGDIDLFIEAYVPEEDGEAFYQEAIRRGELIEDLGIVYDKDFGEQEHNDTEECVEREGLCMREEIKLLKGLQEEVENLKTRISALECNSEPDKKNEFKKFPADLDVGDTFDLDGFRWQILDIVTDGYLCMAGKMFFDLPMVFGSDNNWKSSELRSYLNDDLYEKISYEVGGENILPFERDLLSVDGQDEYGKCHDKVSLLSFDEYRKYRKRINDAYCDWWLLTPWSTPSSDYDTASTIVLAEGAIFDRRCNEEGGVRPVCVFSPAIFTE